MSKVPFHKLSKKEKEEYERMAEIFIFYQGHTRLMEKTDYNRQVRKIAREIYTSEAYEIQPERDYV